MFEIQGEEQLRINLRGMPAKILKQAVKIISIGSRVLQRYLRVQRMTGGTSSTRLAVRSGRLRASVVPTPILQDPNSVSGGINVGAVYSRVHIGRRGQKTVIRPKKGKYLAIPIGEALTKAGVAKGGPTSNRWGKTFVQKSKKGNLIIFGQKRIMKEKREGELRSAVLPLFLLLKQVTIPARIDPQEAMDFIKPKLIQDFETLRYT